MTKIVVFTGAGVSVALIMLGGVCAVHWRRHSLAYRDKLQQEHRKPKGNI